MTPPLAESVSPCFHRFVRALIDAFIANQRAARTVAKRVGGNPPL